MRQYRCAGPCGSLLLGDDNETPACPLCVFDEGAGLQGGEPFAESDWLACRDIPALFIYLRARASERKTRLFACACLRRRPLIHYGRLRQAIETGEEFADGLVEAAELEEVADWARALWHQHVMRSGPAALLTSDEVYFAQQVAGCLRYPANTLLWVAEPDDLPLLHDVFGNPFRRVTVAPSWLAWNGGSVRKIAEGIYNERAFGHMPILGDALEEAGCTDTAILDHCRGPGSHVRGCHLLDALLGRG